MRSDDDRYAGPSSSTALPTRSRRPSVSSGGEPMIFSLSGSSDGSSRGRRAQDSGRERAPSTRPSASSSSRVSSSSGSWEPTRPTGGAGPSSRFFGGGDTSSSDSASRSSGRRGPSSAGDSRQSSDIFGGGGSGSGSAALDIPGRTGALDRRPVVRSPGRYPASGYTDQYKDGAWDSWKSDAPLRREHENYKRLDNAATSLDRRYNDALDRTPPARTGGLGESHSSINTNLTGSQRKSN